jgi:hypothetical protein
VQAAKDNSSNDLEKILEAFGASEIAPGAAAARVTAGATAAAAGATTAAAGASTGRDSTTTDKRGSEKVSSDASEPSQAAKRDGSRSSKGSHGSTAGGEDNVDDEGDGLQERADALIAKLKNPHSSDPSGVGNGGDDLAGMADSFRDGSSGDLGALGMVMASMQGAKGQKMSDEQKQNFMNTLGAALSGS